MTIEPQRVPIPLIIDTDLSLGEPGSEVDDGFALAVAVAEPAVEILAVTTVFGNTQAETAAVLTESMLRSLGRDDIPVFAGDKVPLGRPSRFDYAAPQEHRLRYEQLHSERGDAADAMIRLVGQRPGEIVVLAIGPLTNVARALQRRPELASEVRELVVMGGIFQGQMNISWLPGEFNVWSDPDALAVVLQSSIPLRMVGLDVTRSVRFSRREAVRLSALGGVAAQLGQRTVEWIDETAARLPGVPSLAESCSLHDVLALLAVVHPDLLEWHEAHLAVETQSDLTRGVIIADLLATADAPAPNARIALEVDAQRSIDIVTDCLAALSD